MGASEGLPQEDSSVSLELFDRLRVGEEAAAEEIFRRYLHRLTRLARSRLSPRLARRVDAEDVVLSAWRSFFLGARAGKFSLRRSGDLWRLLAAITLHKTFRHVRRHSAQMRSAACELPLERLAGASEEFLAACSREPSPEEALTLADELENLMMQLDSCGRRVLELRLQGESLEAIATALGCSQRTVRRLLAEIRNSLLRRLESQQNG